MWIAHAMMKPLIFSFAGTAQYFQSVGLPGALVTPVFAAELAIGAALVFGIYARQAALLSLPVLAQEFRVKPVAEKKVKELVITKEMIERKAPVFDIIGPRIEEAA